MGKNHEEKQRELINLTESIHPDVSINLVKKIQEQFTNFVSDNPNAQLLSEFKKELKFIEDVIKGYESSRNSNKGSEPIHVNSTNNSGTILDGKEYACITSVTILKNSGDRILKTLNTEVSENNFISKVMINISSNLTFCINTTINIFQQNNKVDVKTTSEENSLINDFVMLPPHSGDTISKDITIEVKVGGEL